MGEERASEQGIIYIKHRYLVLILEIVRFSFHMKLFPLFPECCSSLAPVKNQEKV